MWFWGECNPAEYAFGFHLTSPATLPPTGELGVLVPLPGASNMPVPSIAVSPDGMDVYVASASVTGFDLGGPLGIRGLDHRLPGRLSKFKSGGSELV